jgi:hypothetical protein
VKRILAAILAALIYPAIRDEHLGYSSGIEAAVNLAFHIIAEVDDRKT